jgi:hypothetical protein
VIRIFGQNSRYFDFGGADQMVAELCEAHDEVDGRLLQICGDLKTRVLPSGNWLFCLAALSLVPKL